jgi:hypothetical protein
LVRLTGVLLGTRRLRVPRFPRNGKNQADFVRMGGEALMVAVDVRGETLLVLRRARLRDMRRGRLAVLPVVAKCRLLFMGAEPGDDRERAHRVQGAQLVRERRVKSFVAVSHCPPGS